MSEYPRNSNPSKSSPKVKVSRVTSGHSRHAVLLGDTLSLFCDSTNGYLPSPGVADPRVLVHALSDSEQTYRTLFPNDFEKSIFVFEASSLGNRSFMMPFSEGAAGAAQEAKEAEPVGKPLMFGATILIRHVHTGLYVIANRGRRSQKERSCTMLFLGSPAVYPRDQRSEQPFCFKVMPRYKLRHEGDAVVYGDHILLVSALTRTSLHCSPSVSPAGEIEANLSVNADAWMISHYVTSGERQRAATKGIATGREVVVFHKEIEAFFSADCTIQLELGKVQGQVRDFGEPGDTVNFVPALSSSVLQFVHPNIADTTYSVINLDFSTNSLWRFEHANPTRGGLVRLSEAHRIKHVVSGAYLAVVPAGDTFDLRLIYYTSVEEDDHADDYEFTIWILHPCDDDENENFVSSESTFCRIQNKFTGQWLHSLEGAAQYTQVDTSQKSKWSCFGSVVFRKNSFPSAEATQSLRKTSCFNKSTTTGEISRQRSLSLSEFSGVFDALSVHEAHESNLCPYPVCSSFVHHDGKREVATTANNRASNVSLSDKGHYSDVFCICGIAVEDALEVSMITGNLYFMRSYLYHFLNQKAEGGPKYGTFRMEKVIRDASEAVSKLITWGLYGTKKFLTQSTAQRTNSSAFASVF